VRLELLIAGDRILAVGQTAVLVDQFEKGDLLPEDMSAPTGPSRLAERPGEPARGGGGLWIKRFASAAASTRFDG
jgi:hypothetical protein